MAPWLTEGDARAALESIDRGQRPVIDEIGLPRWYLFGLAACWVVLGIVSDAGNGWASAGLTVAFVAMHGWVAPRVVGGRRRTNQLSVVAAKAGRRTGWTVIAGLVALGTLTVVVSLMVRADGARHPTTLASVLAATTVVLAGPQFFARVRARARGADTTG